MGWIDIESQPKRYETEEQRPELLKNKINVLAYKNTFLPQREQRVGPLEA